MSSTFDSILSYFHQINAIPRCSGNEDKLTRWLAAWADRHGWSSRRDAAGNLTIDVPATRGCEAAPTVILQGHMDMVCEKTPQSSHDFNTDPIRPVRSGDWLSASDTTLGADNGIAIALAMTIAEDEELVRPPLELLFTVDEERGLNGVKALGKDMISGRLLLNLDSETEGVLTIGCAGGQDTLMTKEMDAEPLKAGMSLYRLDVDGLKGGHSGVDIHKQRGCANQILARCLFALSEEMPLQLVHIDGGTRHNAIARNAAAVFALPQNAYGSAKALVKSIESVLRAELGDHDPGLSIGLSPVQTDSPKGDVVLMTATAQIVDLLMSLPHGVVAFSSQIDGLVETSCNLATVALSDGKLSVLTSQRSSVMRELEKITSQIHDAARQAAASAADRNGYPAWQPQWQSPLLALCQSTYATLFEKQARVEVIHAGLECALIGDRFDGIQMVSYGPTIENPHSPSERLHLPSVGRIYRMTSALFEQIARGADRAGV